MGLASNEGLGLAGAEPEFGLFSGFGGERVRELEDDRFEREILEAGFDERVVAFSRFSSSDDFVDGGEDAVLGDALPSTVGSGALAGLLGPCFFKGVDALKGFAFDVSLGPVLQCP